MIIVKGAIPVKAARREDALRLVQGLAQRSLSEPGCLEYEVCVRADEPATIVIFQQWADLEALEAHFASAHVDGFLDEIPDLIEGPVESARFEVLAEEILEDVDEMPEPAAIHYGDSTTLH